MHIEQIQVHHHYQKQRCTPSGTETLTVSATFSTAGGKTRSIAPAAGMGYGYRSFYGDFAAKSYGIISYESPAGTATNGSFTGETTAATLGAR